MKAFSVQETDECTGAIVFANSNIEARKWGAHEYNDGELGGLSCRRVPWADRYQDKGIPAREMIAHGWWFECGQCGHTINEDWLCDNHLPIDGVIGTQHSNVFCGKRCAKRFYSLERRRKAQERIAIDELKTVVRKRFGDVEFDDTPARFHGHHARVVSSEHGWIRSYVFVDFKFPGMKIGPASCRVDVDHVGWCRFGPPKIEYLCCSGDREAFEAWARSIPMPAQGDA